MWNFDCLLSCCPGQTTKKLHRKIFTPVEQCDLMQRRREKTKLILNIKLCLHFNCNWKLCHCYIGWKHVLILSFSRCCIPFYTNNVSRLTFANISSGTFFLSRYKHFVHFVQSTMDAPLLFDSICDLFFSRCANWTFFAISPMVWCRVSIHR